MDVTPQQAKLEVIDAVRHISRATSKVCQLRSRSSTIAGMKTHSNCRYDLSVRKISAKPIVARSNAAQSSVAQSSATKRIDESCTAEERAVVLSAWVQSLGYRLLGIVAFDHLGLPTGDWCPEGEITQQTIKTLFELLSLNLLLNNHLSGLGSQQHLVIRGKRNLILVLPWEQGYLGAQFQGEIPSELVTILLSQLRVFTGFSTVTTQEVAA